MPLRSLLKKVGAFRTARSAATGLRCELFVADLPASLSFYTDVLGFRVAGAEIDGHAPMKLGRTRLSLHERNRLPPNHYFSADRFGDAGVGVELVVEVTDIDLAYRRLRSSGWPRYEPLQKRPWGLLDFRVMDPDGYYVRMTQVQAT